MSTDANALFKELVEYLPLYKVLVCRKCRFAVQPTAISGHLQRHKIFREKRKALLDIIQALPLAEPDEVAHPMYTPPRIPSLPVFQGYVCLSTDCHHSCASLKRMQRHWAVDHGRPCRPNEDYRLAALQTFFKGNKLRYFEVIAAEDELEDESDEPREPDQETLASSEPLAINKIDVTLESPSYLDLKLMHQFTVYTGSTLERGVEADTFWPVTVPQLAYDNPCLMHGVLGVAAAHLAFQCPKESTKYRMAIASHLDLALPLYREALHNVTEQNSTVVAVFARLMLAYHCASILASGDCVLKLLPAHSDILNFIFIMRGGCSVMLEIHPHVLYVANMRINPRVYADCIFAPPPNDIAHRLGLLKQDLIELCTTEELQIIETSHRSLTHSFAISYSGPERVHLWAGVEYWPTVTGHDFASLMSAQHPAALVVFAHYCILINRLADKHWFMHGHAQRFVFYIETLLMEEQKYLISWPYEVVRPKP